MSNRISRQSQVHDIRTFMFSSMRCTLRCCLSWTSSNNLNYTWKEKENFTLDSCVSNLGWYKLFVLVPSDCLNSRTSISYLNAHKTLSVSITDCHNIHFHALHCSRTKKIDLHNKIFAPNLAGRIRILLEMVTLVPKPTVHLSWRHFSDAICQCSELDPINVRT